jgi:hypothetical protein
LSGYTSSYSAIINLRLGFTVFIGLSAIVFSAIIYWYSKNKKDVTLTISWLAPGVISAVLLLYVGLPFMARPALFFFISWAPLGAWVYNRLDQKRWKTLKIIFVSVFIVLPALLLPIIKYAPMPFTFATSQELDAVTFTATYYNGSSYLYLEASPPYSYAYIAYGFRNASSTLTLDFWYIPEEGLDQNLIGRYPTLVIYRVITRDAFWVYNPSMSDVVNNFTLCEETLNKVYDSGWPYSVFTPHNPWAD